jgi:hypothetical protein
MPILLLPIAPHSSTYAIVKPEKAPPSSTKIRAVVKYIHKLGSSGEGSSSVMCNSLFTGAALVIESWPSPITIIFASPRTAGRVEVYPLLVRLPAVAALLEIMFAAYGPREDFRNREPQ